MWLKIEARELVLPGDHRHRQPLDQPVVKRAVVLELERAERVRHALDRVRLAVGEVVGGIDAPVLPGARMSGVEDAVEHRVAHVDVGRRHVDLRPEHPRTFGELARPHAPEEVEALRSRAGPAGAVAPRLGERAAVGADFVRREVVHVGVAGLNQVLGPLVETLEVVGGEVKVFAPVEAEPAHVFLDRLDELVLLLGRIGVVEAHVAAPAELLRHAEVETDRLGVPDVQIAVGLGREACDHLVMPPGRKVGADYRPNEIVAGAHATP